MLFKQKIKKNKKKYAFKKSGFTLVETLIAMLLFTLIVVMISGVFVAFLKNYILVRNAQRSTESAQFAINLMAKTIRTSQSMPQDDITAAGQEHIDLFDFSQGSCLRYSAIQNKITVSYTAEAIPPSSITDCHFDTALGTPQDITSSEVELTGFFTIVPTDSENLGAVRIVLSVNEVKQTASPLLIQTSVSLRNF